MFADPDSDMTSVEPVTKEPPLNEEQAQLKILRVAPDIYPDVMGGYGLHVHEMSRMQTEMGHEVTVLASDHGDRSKPKVERRNGYKLIRHREIISPLGNSIIPGLAKSLFIMAGDYDIIHAHSHLFFSTNLTAIYRHVSDTPLAITNHGLISQTAPKWLQRVFIPTIAKYTLESADTIFCYTETDERRLRKRGVTSNICVVSNGIDCDLFQPNDESTEGLQVLFVGRLRSVKGIDTLLSAFVDVLEEHPNASLKVVGNGTRKNEYVDKSVRLGISSNVEFVGQVLNENMPEVYSESDVFTLPSSNEGLPRTILEAMACEVPVVVSDLEQLESVIQGAGKLIPYNNPEKLASALIHLLSNGGLRKQMGKVGRKRIKSEFSWGKTVRQTTNVCQNLANGN